MIKITELSIDIIGKLQEFTNINNLLLSCNNFQKIKKYLYYWKLTKEYSKIYYMDANFRKKIIAKMFNSKKQLYVDLSFDLYARYNNTESYQYVSDVTVLNNLHTLILSGCIKIRDISPLNNIYKLILIECSGITDVSSLKDTCELNLMNCRGVTNVDSLKKVRKLNISWCPNITDVSCLDQVEELDISGCFNLTDISALKTVLKLHANWINKMITQTSNTSRYSIITV